MVRKKIGASIIQTWSFLDFRSLIILSMQFRQQRSKNVKVNEILFNNPKISLILFWQFGAD